MTLFFLVTGLASLVYAVIMTWQFFVGEPPWHLFYFAWVLGFYAVYALTVGI